MAGDDQIPPIIRLCIISLLVSLCQLACLIRFGDGLAPSEPPTDDVGSNYCASTPGTVSRGFQFCEIPRKISMHRRCSILNRCAISPATCRPEIAPSQKVFDLMSKFKLNTARLRHVRSIVGGRVRGGLCIRHALLARWSHSHQPHATV